MPDTNDLLWKLRNTRWQGTEWASLMFAAADEIERLRAEKTIPICVVCGKPAIGNCEATSSIHHRTK